MKSTFVILLHVKQNKMNIVILNAFLINKTNELFIFYSDYSQVVGTIGSVNRNLSFFSTLLLTFSKPVSCEV